MKKLLAGCLLAGISATVSGAQVPDSVAIPEVLVTATLPLDNQKMINFCRTSHFSTIDDVLSRLEGLSLIKRGAYAMEPQLGGFSAGQLNITIDGMKIFGACTDKMDPVTSYIEPSNLKSIRVNRGTTATETGCNIGGSVDLTLNDLSSCGCNSSDFSLTTGYESVSNGKNGVFNMALSRDKWAWGLNAVWRKNDNYRAGNGNEIAFTQFEKTNLHNVVLYKPNQRDRLKADVLIDYARNVGYAALPMDVSKAQGLLAALEYERVQTNPLKIKLYANDVLHIMDDSHRDSVYSFSNRTTGQTDTVLMRMDMPGRSTTLGAYAHYTLHTSENNKIVFKLESYSNRSLAEMTMYMHFKDQPAELPMYMQTWPEMRRSSAGLFVQDDYRLNDQLAFTLNGRVDYNIDVPLNNLARQQFSVLNYHLSNRFSNLTKGINAAVRLRMAEPLTATLTSGWSERLPSITERFGYYLYNAYDGYDYIGNPYLKTEKSWFSEVTLSYNSRQLKVNLSQNASLLCDYILGETDNNTPQLNFYANGLRRFTNRDAARLFSTNMQIVWQPMSSVSVLSVTKYSYGELSSGDAIPLIPPLNHLLAISYESGAWIWIAENEAAAAQKHINTDYGEKTSVGYSIFNLRCSYEIPFSHSRLALAAGISNLTNKTYSTHLDWARIPRPGLNVNIVCKYSF